MKICKLLIVIVTSLPIIGFSQNSGEIHGDFGLSLQSYQEDLQIGAQAAC